MHLGKWRLLHFFNNTCKKKGKNDKLKYVWVDHMLEEWFYIHYMICKKWIHFDLKW